MDRKIKGYNIFEILVVLVIMGILIALAIRPILVFVANQRLNEAVNMVVSDLNEAKIYSISKKSLMGITADNGSNSYIIFQNNDDNCSYNNGSDTIVKTITLPSGITFKNDVFFLFDRKGLPRNASCGLGMGNIKLQYKLFGDIKNIKTICVDRYGRIRVLDGDVSCD
ncbi:prepilin-type N-terminal cleavage/methylation domain-containing protein [Sulfurihydrogenibium sp.]|jgi:type IV fimbrial biogenesis protein FimT|uniref:pilus assembly FimT family protein n=1 Tax=Sulfurihydrogenibium sp. TaxID=2053621 RepID=UPI00260F71A2|nr:prepilin-type N-terminal cleavage/methylation domain-containing protein [Sulfurihydrogenibium sp.]